jgi:hypothetical protein
MKIKKASVSVPIGGILFIFWALDVLNVSFMEIFDTKYPINSLVWFLIWLLVPSTIKLFNIEFKDNN